jgi:hypothetical protein
MELDTYSKQLFEDINKNNEIFSISFKSYILDKEELRNKNAIIIESYEKFKEAIHKINKNNKINFILLKTILIFYKNLRSFYYRNINQDFSDANSNQSLKFLLFYYFEFSKFSYMIYLFATYIISLYTNKISKANHVYLQKLLVTVYNENDEEVNLNKNKDLCYTNPNNTSDLQSNNGLNFCLNNHLFLKINIEFNYNDDLNINEKKEKILSFLNDDFLKSIIDIREYLNVSKNINPEELIEKINNYDKLSRDKNGNLFYTSEELKKYINFKNLKNKIKFIIEIFEKIIKSSDNKDLLNFIIYTINILKIIIGKLKFKFFDLNYIYIQLLNIKYGIIRIYDKSLFDHKELDFFIIPIDEFIDFITSEYMKIISDNYIAKKK